MMGETGAADVVLVAGVESMSNIEYYTTDMRWGARAGSATLHDRLQRGRERSQPPERFGHISGMPETAENLAREYGITREQSDAFAVRSHQRAAAAWADGKFAAEVVALTVEQKKGPPLIFAQDEGIRGGSIVGSFARLNPGPTGRRAQARDARQRQPPPTPFL